MFVPTPGEYGLDSPKFLLQHQTLTLKELQFLSQPYTSLISLNFPIDVLKVVLSFSPLVAHFVHDMQESTQELTTLLCPVLAVESRQLLQHGQQCELHLAEGGHLLVHRPDTLEHRSI
jgi:hypothetical protein